MRDKTEVRWTDILCVFGLCLTLSIGTAHLTERQQSFESDTHWHQWPFWIRRPQFSSETISAASFKMSSGLTEQSASRSPK